MLAHRLNAMMFHRLHLFICRGKILSRPVHWAIDVSRPAGLLTIVIGKRLGIAIGETMGW